MIMDRRIADLPRTFFASDIKKQAIKTEVAKLW
jgi:hypothetical protein